MKKLIAVISCLIITMGVIKSSTPEEMLTYQSRKDAISDKNHGTIHATNAVHKAFTRSGQYEPQGAATSDWCCGE